MVRRDYGEALAAYCCLGVLQVAQGDAVYHYLVLVTDCQSVGKVRKERERERRGGVVEFDSEEQQLCQWCVQSQMNPCSVRGMNCVVAIVGVHMGNTGMVAVEVTT